MEYIITRAAWSAEPARSVAYYDPSKIEGITVHHSAGKVGSSEQEVFKAVRAIQRFHKNRSSKPFHDIAYNFLISQTGLVIEGRGFGIQQGASNGWNKTTIAVCFLADFTTEVPTSAAINAFTKLRQCVLEKMPQATKVRPHRLAPGAATACPGIKMDAIFDRLLGSPSGVKTIEARPTVALQTGFSGEEVAWLQRRLNRVSICPSEPLIEDGRFGPKTRSAVIKFQKWSGLASDGIFGAQSLAKMDAIYSLLVEDGTGRSAETVRGF